MVVGERDADDVAARAPTPVDLAIPRHQAVQEVVVGAHIDSIVERQHVIRRSAETTLPQALARLDLQSNHPIGATDIDPVGRERRARSDFRADILAPDDFAIRRSNGDERARRDRRDQPAVVPDERRPGLRKRYAPRRPPIFLMPRDDLAGLDCEDHLAGGSRRQGNARLNTPDDFPVSEVTRDEVPVVHRKKSAGLAVSRRGREDRFEGKRRCHPEWWRTGGFRRNL